MRRLKPDTPASPETQTEAVRATIRAELGRCGTISFERFMELALYHAQAGYYERSAPAPGRQGDFFTSVSVGPMFGGLLAFQFARWLSAVGFAPPAIAEAGAHDGSLAFDILSWMRTGCPPMSEQLRYWLVEPSKTRRSWQAAKLRTFAHQVAWVDDPRQLGRRGFRGILFSNEFLDAFPVRRLRWNRAAQRWDEWGVTDQDGQFAWRLMRPTPILAQGTPVAALEGADAVGRRLLPLPPGVLAALPDGFTTEVSPQAVTWWRTAAECLRDGWLLTFDYGLETHQLAHPARPQGTLRAYRRHRLSADPLAFPGDQDLTAHVNFTAIRAAGETAGLRTLFCDRQGKFLTAAAADAARETPSFASWTRADRRQFLTLTHPDHLGDRFCALVQTRRNDRAQPLCEPSV